MNFINSTTIAKLNYSKVQYNNSDVISCNDYLPFGQVMPGRHGDDETYKYGFNNMLKDDELKGNSNSYDFGARIYDPRIGRWLSCDPLAYKYAPISSYAYVLNNPIIFIDIDGREVIGSDGKPVTYEKGEDGVIKWSENATQDIKEVGEAMMTTKFGEQAFGKWQTSSTKIKIVIDKETESTILAETKPKLNDEGVPLVKDGQYEEADVIFYKKKIEADRKEGSGKRFDNASYEETLGTVGVHEVYHNEKEQIKIDEKQPNEFAQDKEKTLPINSEINFRQEYHEKNKNLPNDKTWKNKYNELKYEGIKVKEEKK